MTWIDKVNGVVIKLQWFKPVAIIMAVGFAVVAAMIIFTDSGFAANDDYLLPCVVACVWSILLYGVLSGFAVIPAKPCASLSWWQRTKIRVVRGYYWLLLWLCIATTVVAIQLLIRAITI